MKKTIKVPYGLKKLALGAAVVALPVFTSCSKDEQIDPTETAQKELNVAAAAFRASIAPARAGIEPYFEVEETAAKNNIGNPQNLKDSCDVYTAVANGLWGAFGNPLPKNATNVQNMHTTANACLEKIAAYEAVRGK